MESASRLNNPHLRARLAEGLEALLPHNDELNNQSTPTLGTFHRQQLFVTHPHKEIVLMNLLKHHIINSTFVNNITSDCRLLQIYYMYLSASK